jgi:FlaA1/EpsC-like NDP-sugar epimerase
VTIRFLEQLCSMASPLVRSRRTNLSARFGLQLLLTAIAGTSAFLLRFDFALPSTASVCLLWAVAIWMLVKPASLHVCGATGGAWRYFSTPDLMRLLAGHVCSSVVAGVALVLFCPVSFPRSVLLIDFVLAVSLGGGVRTIARVCYELASQRRRTKQHRTLMYGAGQAGVMLLQEARKNPNFPYEICGFVDDAKHIGLLVQGVRVLGRGRDLKRLIGENRISQILIATPSATGAQMSQITSYCQGAGVAFKTMPAISEILAGRGLAKQIREVAVEDVLGRSSVHLEDDKIRTRIQGKVVLVTGAAGSIGSEMCRQIARYSPAVLVGFEISETALFFLEREMKEMFPELEFRPTIGSIQSLHRLREVFAEHLPALVLHAAAYKHVPLMEKHMFEAVENNVFGTYNLATAAREYGVQDFVMISSDKAVNPTNIMGTTKRVAELLIRSFQNGGPRYVSVRFGNVLGSNGSVVPIFKKQIAQGGPVTITHPDMERYFMTIPEAAQLVLQACTMGRGGEIFVLDMGKPVKIVDLARQLIRLSGLEPDKDIQIEFSGVRPGEKLFEELNMADEDMVGTHHEKIKIFSGNALPDEEMTVHLQRLRKACEQRNPRALVRELKLIVPDYTASKDVVERAFTDNLVNLGRVLQFNPAAEPEAVGMQVHRRH